MAFRVNGHPPFATITLWTGLGSTAAPSSWPERMKYAMRAAARPLHSRSWFHLLNSEPAVRAHVARQPRTVLKIYRPYHSMALGTRERIELLAAHYRFISARGLDGLAAQASREEGVELARFPGKSGRALWLRLRVLGTMEREGELVLQLGGADGALYSAAFTIGRDGHLPVLHVGCLQGPAGEDALGQVREVTRELHGVRPKNFLFTVLRGLGHALGARQMRLVGNANRVVRCSMRRAKVHADYDQFWIENGARRALDGDYRLSCMPPAAPDLVEIPSKRRAEYRRRHELQAEVLRMAAAVFRA